MALSERMPPLTALRAFDAAARHGSFSRAAEELHVTPAALSYQIKRLEEHLGAALFLRLNRAVELTEAGHALRPGIADGFASFLAAQRAVRRLSSDGALNVTAGPALTAKWLAPRMFRFAAAHPETELRFVATLKRMDVAREDVDAALRFGPTPPEGVFAADLGADALTPLCTPQLAATLTCPEDLLEAPLLLDDHLAPHGPAPGWSDWLRAAGLPEPAAETARGHRFSAADHAIDAAAAGGGVVLGRVFLAMGEIAAGRLTAPFPFALPTAWRYRFLCAAGAQSRPAVRDFLSWLREENRATRAAAPDWTGLAAAA